MNMSSVSYNSRFFEQFKSLDSISQIGGDSVDQQLPVSMDLGSLQVELKLREEKIKAYRQKEAKFKELMKKAKAAIDSWTAKCKSEREKGAEVEGRLREATERNKDLTRTLEIWQEKRNGIRSEQVKSVLARIKVNEVGYTLVESKDMDVEWYKDNQILNVQEDRGEMFKVKKQVNYNGIWQEMSRLEEQMITGVQQYEERLKRVSEYMEQSNQSYLKVQDEFKQARTKQDEELKARDLFVERLMARSHELKKVIQTAVEAKPSKRGGSSIISELEMSLAKMAMDLKLAESLTLSELRDHFIEIYSKLCVGLLKRH